MDELASLAVDLIVRLVKLFVKDDKEAERQALLHISSRIADEAFRSN